jgi:hypothetical protein
VRVVMTTSGSPRLAAPCAAALSEAGLGKAAGPVRAVESLAGFVADVWRVAMVR